MPKPRRFHALKRPKLRQTWNKYNLFNFYRERDPKIGFGNGLSPGPTFFQQKWRAKGLLRSYHGEHIRERDWERMFSRRLLSVADMNPKAMAMSDGSEHAAGRGSGKDKPPNWNDAEVKKKTITPYMNMAFAPMERRLDIAIFRAMFASSVRQARMFCVHGLVKVNGKVMHHSMYRLNPGDMFQVEPESVLYATGMSKNGKSSGSKSSSAEVSEETSEEASEEVEPVEAVAEAEEAGAEEETKATDPEQDPDTTDKPEPTPEDMKPTRKAIQALTGQAKGILSGSEASSLSVKQKRDLRAFIKGSKALLSKSGRPTASSTEIVNELNKMVSELKLDGENSSAQKEEEAAPSSNSFTKTSLTIEDLDVEERKALARLIREEEENPPDPSKPYKTPWQPRPFMSPFAFIPRYLEVNQNICSAVYLRHPVARLGSAEVPTPYNYNTNQLAFNWYLRRR